VAGDPTVEIHQVPDVVAGEAAGRSFGDRDQLGQPVPVVAVRSDEAVEVQLPASASVGCASLRGERGVAAERRPVTSGAPPLLTPEAVVLEYPLATVGSRAVALALDLALQAAGFVGLLLVGGVVAGATGLSLPGWVGVTVVLLLSLVLQLGYPIVLESAWRGRTLGKAALGLRVLTTEGGPVGVRHASLRAMVGLVDFTLTLGAAALVSSLVTGRHQRLGDLAAGTVVVRERTANEPLDAVTFAPPPGLEHYVGTVDVSAVDPATYQTLRALLRRAPSLDLAVRDRLAADLADRVVGRVRPAPPAGTAPLAFLAAVAAAVQARRGRPGVAPGRQGSGPAGTKEVAGPPAPPEAPGARNGPVAGPEPRGGGGFAPPA
jgi:uncharacterized RDD family membrane protein YckC